MVYCIASCKLGGLRLRAVDQRACSPAAITPRARAASAAAALKSLQIPFG